MRNTIFVTCVLAVIATAASAQTFEKKHYNYSEWTKGRFSEAVTVTGPAKMIFLAGVGSEDENGKGGDILHKGDFTAQCKYSFENGQLLDRCEVSGRFRQVPSGDFWHDADACAHPSDNQPTGVAWNDGGDRRDGRRSSEIE